MDILAIALFGTITACFGSVFGADQEAKAQKRKRRPYNKRRTIAIKVARQPFKDPCLTAWSAEAQEAARQKNLNLDK